MAKCLQTMCDIMTAACICVGPGMWRFIQPHSSDSLVLLFSIVEYVSVSINNVLLQNELFPLIASCHVGQQRIRDSNWDHRLVLSKKGFRTQMNFDCSTVYPKSGTVYFGFVNKAQLSQHPRGNPVVFWCSCPMFHYTEAPRSTLCSPKRHSAQVSASCNCLTLMGLTHRLEPVRNIEHRIQSIMTSIFS